MYKSVRRNIAHNWEGRSVSVSSADNKTTIETPNNSCAYKTLSSSSVSFSAMR